WSNGGRHDGRDAVERKRQASLLRRKGVCKNGLSHRLQSAATGALQNAEEKKQPETRRQATKQRTNSKNTQTAHEKALPSQSACEPSADWQDDGIRDQIRRQHP